MNEFSEKSKADILIQENSVPIKKSVQVACEMLGLDSFDVGNEWRIVIGAAKDNPDEVLNLLKGTEEGRDAEIIGETTADFKGVAMQTRVGGKRIVSGPVGDPIPRICRSTNARS